MRVLLRWCLDRAFPRLIRQGTLLLRLPDGRLRRFGDGAPEVVVTIRDWRTVRRLLLNPALALGEAYVEGAVEIAPTLQTLLALVFANLESGAYHPIAASRRAADYALRRLRQFTPPSRARRNVAHHYDLNGQLYGLFLDSDRQYSCAYFRSGTETLEEAQRAKKRHIAAKLLLTRPGMTVLDIGSGWGGLAITLARDYGARVLGITLSAEQLEASRARAAAEGLADRVRFEPLDYRDVRETFDRVVSVGMFEHVGLAQYRRFFQVVRERLAPDGVALIHAIGRLEGPGVTNPWLRKYIFPGGYSPALSEVLPHVEHSGLYCTDVEILRLHYARTLACWQKRFAANREAIRALYDERFCRMFALYLAGAELAFRHLGHAVWQMQLARRIDTVPITRDYIAASETDAERAALAHGRNRRETPEPVAGS